MSVLEPWSTTAINLPDHADNLIHTDEGARAAGFESALVAGTTVYAYMTHPAMVVWGEEWLSGGGGELRLRRPVFDRDRVDCAISEGENGPVVTATVAGDARASLALWRTAEVPAVRSGEPLDDLHVVLTEAHIDYGVRCGDDLTIYSEKQIAHPVTWANLANTVFRNNLVTGPWIHVRSRIFHQSLAHVGAHIRVASTLIERFDSRAGERAIVDMAFYADDRPLAVIEHEAVITLPR